MDIQKYQQWVSEFYKIRGWYELSPFIRMNFLSEETGEVSRAIRSIEIGRDRPDEAKQTEAELLENLKEDSDLNKISNILNFKSITFIK